MATHHRIIGATLFSFAALVLTAAVRVVPQIEGDLSRASDEVLLRNGAAWASVSVTGRTVTLAGGPVSHEARLSTVALLRAVPGVKAVRSLVLPPDPLPEPDPEPAYGPGLEGSETGGAEDDGRAGSASGVDAPTEGPEASSPAPSVVAANQGASQEESQPPAVPEPTAAPTVSCSASLNRLADGRALAFPEGSQAISAEDQALLVQVARELNRCGEWTLTMVGYAGESEGADSWALADRRAYAVARFLMARGVDESRLAAVTGSGLSDAENFARVEVFVSGGQ